MAKSSRYSGGCYRNVIHPTGESEGSGCSGRVDPEINVSENSSVPHIRKCIQLNKNQDAFGVNTQVLSLSNMSSFERKKLRDRLTVELGEVRGLMKKVELHRSNAVLLSSSNDIASFDRKKGSKVGTFKKSKALISGLEKKNALAHKGRGWNRGSSGKFQPAPQASIIQTSTNSTANTILMKQCEALLKRLMAHQYGWIFNTPVDVVKLNLSDYFTIIKHPMDLGTVNNKIASGAYSCPLEFVADVRLTFKNAMTYNPPGNDVHIMADTLSKYFEVRWKPIEKKIPKADDMPLLSKPDVTEDLKTLKPMPPSKKRKINFVAPETETKLESAKPLMTTEEKHRLGRELESLIGEIPVRIIDFLREHSSNGRDCGEDEIEIDIDNLSDDTLFTLRTLLDDYLEEKQKNLEKAEPCEIELMNESGPSNSSIQLCKDYDLADEEVDVGGPPVSSYSPVAIEKDITHRSIQSLSPDSARDSDSSSSSDSESDFNKINSRPGVSVNMGSLAEGDEKTRIINPPDNSEAVSGLDLLELDVEPTQCFVESICQKDGESAPTQRQESSSKLYRAAVMKKRFADTILKAREKALAQDEKRDPEKLRIEKEKFEMERQKEKARLLAEAEAAEAARKLAEADAAAEARRKRELEREAARQALLQMEKTVEINENSRFLEDLEMLRAAAVEQLPSSVDETSPDHSQDGLGSFNFGGSNPLERLGLYMKEDEEEEEGDAPGRPNPVNDVEEGEIH